MLALVNGLRSQSAQRCSRVIPARRAIRSSSRGPHVAERHRPLLPARRRRGTSGATPGPARPRRTRRSRDGCRRPRTGAPSRPAGRRCRSGTKTSTTNRPPGRQVRRRVGEAGDLGLLRGQVGQRVEHHEDHGELAGDARGGDVADGQPARPRRPAWPAAGRPSPSTGRCRARARRGPRAAGRSGRCRRPARARAPSPASSARHVDDRCRPRPARTCSLTSRRRCAATRSPKWSVVIAVRRCHVRRVDHRSISATGPIGHDWAGTTTMGERWLHRVR